MIRQARALVRKEFAQHRSALVALSALLLLALLVIILGVDQAARSLSILSSAASYLVVFIPLAAVVLGNRLVVSEYQGRTQLFIESLPIRRSHLVLTKYLLGFLYLLAVASGAVLVVAALAVRTEAVDAGFLALLLLRAAAFVAFVWSFLFLMGLTGRYRVPLYIGIALGLAMIANQTDLDLMHVGPLALIDPRTFPTERLRVPWPALLQTLSATAFCLVLSLILGLLHEGSLAESLSRRMTAREKTSVGCLLLSLLLVAMVLSEKKTKAPYRFDSNAVLSSDRLPIAILYGTPQARPGAGILLARLDTSLAGCMKALGRAALPPLRVAHSADLDARTFEEAKLTRADGVLLRVNLQGHAPVAFEAYLLRAVLDHATKGRAHFEPKQWLHDGFSRWWAEHGTGTTREPERRQLLLRALTVDPEVPLDTERIRRWRWLRERHGEVMAEALAYTGLKVLEEMAGRERVLALGSAVLGRSPPEDVRETFYEWSHPMDRVFVEATGVRWSDFVARWSAWLAARRRDPELAGVLSALPPQRAEVEVLPGAGRIRDVEARLSLRRTEGAERHVCAVLHRRLPVYDDVLSEKEMQREERLCPEGESSSHLPGRYGPGDRIFIAVEVESRALDAPLRVLARRMVIP